MARIRVRDLGIYFHLDRQVRPVTPMMTHVRSRCSTVWALRGLNVEIGPGEGIALIGRNGAGKSTLLRAISGVLPADEGAIEVSGRIGSLLSTDAGLMRLLTGRENAVLLGVLAGLSKPEARAVIGSIKERSGLADAFERPVATYSQGMKARLGFAVIEHVKPEILLLDEVHEAIDETFRAELEERAGQIRDEGGIVIAAGHDHPMLARLCDRVFLLEESGLRVADSFEVAEDQMAQAARA
jgi:ABC-type polysaccharide/polyol phosphate transport system ATPase subunit